ncbi:hypothetical protein UYO_0080 [Lachnospiraceae bacterium JC7]|nr:hypothetical protein UYO_0080 [Lachnospiraceae bacterium JC7]
MTKEEKNEMYRKNRQKQINKRKSKFVSLIALPIIGVALTLFLGLLGDTRQNELATATVLDSMSIGEFLKKNWNGSAIYTGTIKAVDPVSIIEESGEYIELRRTVERIEKITEKDKTETQTSTISDDSLSCDEISIDDVIAPYRIFHDLPSYGNTSSEGPDSNLVKTDFSYVPSTVEGTFFLKCKDGVINSAQYFKSTDVAGESQNAFTLGRTLLWIIIVGLEIYFIFDIIKTTKIIKNIEGMINS